MKKGLIIAVFLIFIATLTACTTPKIPEPSAEELLTKLTDKFNAQGAVAVCGKIFMDGRLMQELNGAASVADSEKKLRLTVGDEEYLYYTKCLLKGKSSKYSVEKIDFSFARALEMLPFSMLDFTYSALNRGEIYKTDGHIIIEFIDQGVKRTFNTDAAVSGGVLSIAYSGNTITETVLTTSLALADKTVKYSAHYTYSAAETVFSALPWAEPADNVVYAQYLVGILQANYQGRTLTIASSGKSTDVGLSVIKTPADAIRNAFVVPVGENYSLYVAYSKPQSFEMLNTTVSEMQIVYNSNYELVSLTLNNSNKYVFA